MNNINQIVNLPTIRGIQPVPGEAITSLATGGNTYTIGPRIDEGNFGVVYNCSDDWGNDLAVKVLKPVYPYDKLKENAEGEFHRLMELRHPNITFVYDAFEYRYTLLHCNRKMFCANISTFRFTRFSWYGLVYADS